MVAFQVAKFNAFTGRTSNSDLPSDLYTGYIEAEYLQVAPTLAGRVATQPIIEGQSVEAGELLFTLDQEQEVAMLGRAKAQLEEQKALLSDLQKGLRPEEIAQLESQLNEAKARLEFASAEKRRFQQTASQNFSSQAALDSAVANYKEALANHETLKQNIKIARLPAREDSINAALERIKAAQAFLNQQEWIFKQRTTYATQAGTIDEIFFRPGEFVNAGIPVLSILLDHQLKVRFYVPPAVHGQLVLGQAITVKANARPANSIKATISFLSKEPEFTPPILYGKDNRDELVFMVEAMLETGHHLTPGIPVDILL